MYKLIFTKTYFKKLSRFLKKHPDIESIYTKCISLLESNPYHPSLRLHKLSGDLKELHSISITTKYRMTIEFLITSNTITPVNIGTHEEVYH